MTTVLALAEGGNVYMAADSTTNAGDEVMPDAARKVIEVPVGGETALLGWCGDGALGKVIGRHLKLSGADRPTDHDLDAWADRTASAITDIVREAGLVDRETGRIDGAAALGFRGRLWIVTDHQAVPVRRGAVGIGSGGDFACGALDAMPTGAPLDRLRRAVAVACARDRYSDEPIYTWAAECRKAPDA